LRGKQGMLGKKKGKNGIYARCECMRVSMQGKIGKEKRYHK
jgi:hypothetical protein